MLEFERCGMEEVNVGALQCAASQCAALLGRQRCSGAGSGIE